MGVDVGVRVPLVGSKTKSALSVDERTSLAMAQSGPATGGEPPVAGGAAGNPAVPGPNLKAGTKSHAATKHHKDVKAAPAASDTKKQ